MNTDIFHLLRVVSGVRGLWQFVFCICLLSFKFRRPLRIHPTLDQCPSVFISGLILLILPLCQRLSPPDPRYEGSVGLMVDYSALF